MLSERPPWDRLRPLFRHGECPAEGFLSRCFVPRPQPPWRTLLQGPVDATTAPPHLQSGRSPRPCPGRPLSALLAPQSWKTSLRMTMRRRSCSGGAPGSLTCSSAQTPHACWPPPPAGEWALGCLVVAATTSRAVQVCITTAPPGFYIWMLNSSHFVCFSFRNVDFSATMPKFTNTQITEHYSTCIKLSTENVSICWFNQWRLCSLVREEIWPSWFCRDCTVGDGALTFPWLFNAAVFSVVLLFLIDHCHPCGKLPDTSSVTREAAY